MKAKLNVLVTGVGGRAVGHQILHALLLCHDRYQVVATDADAFSFGLYLADQRYLVPLANSADYGTAMRQLVDRERLQVILPGTEPEVRVLAEQQASLAAMGCTVICSPPEVVQLCSDKARLYEWLGANGFAVPRSVRPDQWRELVAIRGFPIVGKPTAESGGSRGVAILQNEAEVERYLGERPSPNEVVFQEYVGSADGEYTVGVLVSRAGAIIDSIVMHRKLVGLSLGHQRKIGDQAYVLSTGYSQGYIVKHPLIQEACESLVLRLGIRGPANIQLRLVEGRAVIFEVHPRFSGTTSIRASVGFNEPEVLIRDFVLGETSGRIRYQTDVAAIRAFQHTIVPIADMRVPAFPVRESQA